MKPFQWNLEKNNLLKRTRDVTFEDILNSRLIGVKKHPTRKNQKILLFEYNNYIWIVPYVEKDDHIFLKTAFPSRKYTKLLSGDES